MKIYSEHESEANAIIPHIRTATNAQRVVF